MTSLFSDLTEEDKSKAVKDLIHESMPRPSFFLLIGLSVLMATFGLALNNSAVVIGSMLIAPILSPILSLSLGIVMSDSSLLMRSVRTLFLSSALGVGLAAVSTLFLSNPFGAEVMSRTLPSLIYFSIAFVAGFAVAFARVNPTMSDTIPGIAVSVSLIPPLAVIGMGIARLNWAITSGAFLLFLTNIVGIVFATMIVFSLMNFYIKRSVATATLQEEIRTQQLEAKEKDEE
ncbi:MAG: DUF389 domain-containing protein [Candidatus Moraniibacteriota bacterium]